MMRPTRSLQSHLLVLTLGLVLIIWLAATALTLFDASHELDELLDGHLAQTAAQLVAQQGVRDEDDPRSDAPTAHKYASQVAFQIFNSGVLVAHSANAGKSPIFDGPLGYRTLSAPDGIVWRVFATRGLDADGKIVVGEQLQSRQSILWAILRSLLMPFLVALPVLAVSLWWAVRRGLTPLRSLSSALARRKPQATDPLPLDGLPPDIAPVVESLNSLLTRITELLTNERRFTADAAHELRTPIAAIRAQAQVALASGADAVQREHALRATLEGCDRAARLVEQLLTLARLEAQVTTAGTPVDLVRVARHVAAELAPAALARQQSLELTGELTCMVQGNEALLGVLVRNLVDNAVRYCPERARIVVAVDVEEAGCACLRVSDSGPGLSPEHLQRLGQRFFRVLGQEQPGSGLGWSIVRRIASVHRLRVEVGADAELGGLAVRVSWPAS